MQAIAVLVFLVVLSGIMSLAAVLPEPINAVVLLGGMVLLFIVAGVVAQENDWA